MRKIYLALLLLSSGLAFSQQNVGIGIANPDPSAVLDLTSANQGFLTPRMHAVDRLAIAAPATGLLVYDLDTNCTFLYTGLAWRNLCVSGGGYNDSIYYNPTGSITVVDGGGDKTTPQSAWLTTGNSGTTAGVNFAGTTDAQDFVLKSNSAEVLRITQAGDVGINQPTPNADAILDIESSTKGILIPSLDTAQMNAIVAPPVGLTVFNSTLDVHQFWNGICWVNVGQTVCSFTYSISQNDSIGCLSVSNFSSTSDTLTINLTSGTASPVILSAAGVPAGVLVNFSNNYLTPTAQSVMTMTALPSAPPGTYPITILAASGSTIETLNYSLTVYSFAAVIVPADTTISLAAAQAGGVVATALLTIGSPGACNVVSGTAQLSAQISPSNPGLTVSFGNSALPVPGSTTMSITSNCALQGTYTVTIATTVGSTTSYSYYTITILGPAPIYIRADTQNINLYNLAGSPICPVNDTFIVNAGVTVGSDTAEQTGAASAIETGVFAPGSKIVIINYGSIIGAGGAGGNDFGYGGTVLGGACSEINGAQGGDAIWISTAGVTIDNEGVIAAGGGGGGAGGALGVTECTIDVRPGTGGGGGAGSVGGPGGTDAGGSYPCNPGNPGTLAAGGTGGAICNQGPCTILFLSFGPYNAGQGGTGGALGQAGNTGNAANDVLGGTGVCAPGAGGAAGCPIIGNGNVYSFSGNAVVGTDCP